MAAPSIPNLNTIRSGRGRGRGRGTGSVGSSASLSHEEQSARHDKIVQQTDDDASVSRFSAVEAGYLKDPYAKYFVREGGAQRRFPIINRGTYVRTKAIDRLVDDFLESNPSQKKQVISLGAGTDTRYFRIISRYKTLEEPNWVYHEIDFIENAARKVDPIYRESELAVCVRSPVYIGGYPNCADEPRCVVNAPYYHTHPVDLRTLDPARIPPDTFKEIDPSLPTLIVSECCLCYLTPPAADTVVLFFTQHFFPPTTDLGIVIYEPINPYDAFGRTMVSNLAARGIVLQTLKKYGSLEAQAERLKAYGFTDSRVSDINQLWNKTIDAAEKGRVASLEMVDELEEWELLASHYCVIWGWRDNSEVGHLKNLESWKRDLLHLANE